MRRKVITKEKIIELAEIIIRDEGLKKCSMRRISRDLEVATGTVYNYYESRDDLLLDVFTISWKRTVDEVKTSKDTLKEPIEQIKDAFAIVKKDVKNRNGLGKEIVTYISSDVVERKRLDLRSELTDMIYNILIEKMKNQIKCETLSRWIIIILMDNLSKDREWTSTDWEMFESLMV